MTPINPVFARKRAERRRLAILLFLADEPDLRMGMALLQLGLEACLLPASGDEITADAEFLREAGLVTLEHIGHLPALTLTRAGRETASGGRRVEGVQFPPLE